MNARHQITINIRTSLFAFTALAAVAATAFAPVSASAAWGPGGIYGRTPGNNTGGGFGGKPNSAVMHPGPCVPGAHNCASGGGPSASGKPSGGTFECFRAPCSPNGGQAGHPIWNQGGQAGYPYHPGGGGRWGSDWRPSYGSNGYWHRPGWIGPSTYTTAPVVTTYATAPVQTYATAPVQTYTPAPAQTTYAPPVYTAPVQPAANQSCNCLSKSYAPDGTVVFADNCSKETASAAPGGAQAGYQPR